MVIYQVHIHVRHEVYADYIQWLESEHIAEVLDQPGFTKAELCLRKGGAMESSSREVKMVYHVQSEDHIKAYLSGPALALREKGTDRFPGQFSAHREVWLECSEFKKK